MPLPRISLLGSDISGGDCPMATASRQRGNSPGVINEVTYRFQLFPWAFNVLLCLPSIVEVLSWEMGGREQSIRNSRGLKGFKGRRNWPWFNKLKWEPVIILNLWKSSITVKHDSLIPTSVWAGKTHIPSPRLMINQISPAVKHWSTDMLKRL